jgi:signal transduction histidine kinase/ActR/RegA family two-component response regulator
MFESQVNLSSDHASREEQLFQRDLSNICRRVDRMFMVLLVLEWIGGILAALLVSPRAWEGVESHVHAHVYLAVYLGGAIISFPLLVAWWLPGSVWSRHTIAAGQVLFSSLLIHLTGGRLETHFHIFGSLAFLAMYRDWRVLMTASVIVAFDHALRGMFWPYSVYQSTIVSSWRWVEHVGWVLFEDGVLIVAIRQSLAEMRGTASRQAALEDATRRAESSEKAKGAFLAQMSHEIRTPMTAILGYADMMAMEGQAAEAVQAIRRNGRHLLTVLDDILDLSTIEAEQLRIKKTPTDVAELLRDVQHLMGPRASQRGIGLSLELQNVPAAVSMDTVRLRQILLNLVSNAIKFTNEGTVRIAADYVPATASAGTLTVRVVDTGIGLTEQQRGRLFKSFSQADDSHHRTYGGTGLGLAISKRLAHLLGGDIEVESEAGKGSTFRLRIPVEVCGAGDVEGSEAVSNAGGDEQVMEAVVRGVTGAMGESRRRRILVVDDAADNRRLLRRLLVHAGFDVEVAEDGSTGMTAAITARAEGRGFDLVLMDMMMPRMDGYEATRQLRAAGDRGLIFALTAHVSAEDEEKCRAAGCDDFITKPFDCDALLRRVHGAVGRRGMRVVG